LIAWGLFGETLGALAAFGGLLTILGVAMVMRGGRPKAAH